MMKYFDSHAHYFDARFNEESKERIDILLDTLFSTSVKAIVNVGTSPQTCREAILQSKRYKNMYTALGIHPTDGQHLASIEDALREIETMILDKTNKCVALGEIGLDYHYSDTDKEKQADLFNKQMQLAERLQMPVIIHDREAHADVFEVVCRYPKVRGVLHSYSGSLEMAMHLIKRGYYISFSGTLTFTNAKKVRDCALSLPRDRILIETDAPYLAPHPLRGTLNHSGNLSYTNEMLASLWGISEEECACITAENAERLFGL